MIITRIHEGYNRLRAEEINDIASRLKVLTGKSYDKVLVFINSLVFSIKQDSISGNINVRCHEYSLEDQRIVELYDFKWSKNFIQKVHCDKTTNEFYDKNENLILRVECLNAYGLNNTIVVRKDEHYDLYRKDGTIINVKPILHIMVIRVEGKDRYQAVLNNNGTRYAILDTYEGTISKFVYGRSTKSIDRMVDAIAELYNQR